MKIASRFILTIAACLFATATAPLHLIAANAPSRPILLVLSNHAELGSTGRQTGFFLSEAAHPWEVFREAGYEVTLASPSGGFAPIDPKSFKLDDPANKAFYEAHGVETNETHGVKDTLPLSNAEAGNFAAIFFAGGHGTMWDFPESESVKKLTAAIYENGGVVGAVCHGPAALVDVMLSDGTPLLKGRKVAAFTNSEEEKVELTEVVPFLLQDRLEKSGAEVVTAPDFEQNAVLDGRLATGQNPASARKAAELLIEALQTPGS